jgi:uncharacterized membrane-anchored protein
MNDHLERIIATAIGEGILPTGATLPGGTDRPWPVVLLTGLGAWLAAVPILVSLFLLVFRADLDDVAPYLIGIIMLGGAIALLRKKSLPLFVEQLAVPGLLAGGLALGIGLFGDLPDDTAAAAMTAVSLGLAFLIPQTWLRALLGAAACVLTVQAIGPGWDRLIPQATLFSLLGAVGLWLLMQWLPEQLSLEHDKAEALGSLSSGWILTTLAGLAAWSGMTFLAGASIAPFGGHAGDPAPPYGAFAQLASLALAAFGAIWLTRSWKALRQVWSTIAAVVMIGLAWLMPSLGAVLLILAVCAAQGRWRLAATAGVAAAWIIGAFYYQLAFPLATKAAIMVGAGALLGTLAWIALRGTAMSAHAAPAVGDSARTRLGIAVCALAVLVVANLGIWQKQTLIAEGQPVFVELGPVDPRSLMQGDYMRLAFRLPPWDDNGATSARGAQRPRAVGKIDARGVAMLERLDGGGTLGPGEIAIELTPTRTGWTLVTDAWYFREGDASRWERAKYGEFRVTSDGRALLVGMRGAALEPLLTP